MLLGGFGVFTLKRALFALKRALHALKRALHAPIRPLYKASLISCCPYCSLLQCVAVCCSVLQFGDVMLPDGLGVLTLKWALYSLQKGLFTLERAPHALKRPLYKALVICYWPYCSTTHLFVTLTFICYSPYCSVAMCTHIFALKRALCALKRALHALKRALFALKRAPFVTLHIVA